MTLSTYMTNSHVGREILAEGEISRSIVARMSHDVTNQFGTLDTRCLPDYSQVSGSSSTGGTTQDPSMAPTTLPNSPPVDAVAYNVGVQGSGTTLRLSTYRVQNIAAPVGNVANAAPADVISDLRRVDYWLVTSGSQTLGLARREYSLATSSDIDVDPSQSSEQEKYIIAREVTGLTFQFHDGTAWQDTWDGYTSKTADDGTPMGPPAAIKVTMTVKRAGSNVFNLNRNEVLGNDLTYTFVVAVPGANNFTPKLVNP